MKKLLLLVWLLATTATAWAQLSTSFSQPSICSGTSYDLSYSDPTTVYQPGNEFTVQLSDASGSFASPQMVGSLSSTSGSGTISFMVPFGNGSGYRIRVVASAPVVTGADNGTDITIAPAPPVTLLINPQTICEGQSVAIAASGGITYSWHHNGFTGANQTVSPAASTTYTVTGMNSNGCTATSTVQVNVIPTPNVVATAAPDNICVGGTSVLSASGALMYSWTPGNLTGNLVTVSPTATTTYTVIGADTMGCAGQATVTVVVWPAAIPVTATSNSPICAGNVLQLTASAVPGATYSWTGPGGFTSTQQNPNVLNTTAAISGNYTVTIQSGNCTGTAVVQVVVNPVPAVPAVLNNGPVCEGQPVTLQASAVAGASYSWSGQGVSSVAGATQTITMLSAGTYNYTVVVTANGCTSFPASTTVVVNPVTAAPVVTAPAPVCAGSSITLSVDNPIAGAVYSWSGPSIFFPATGAVVTTQAIPSTIQVTANVNGCPSAATPVTITTIPAPSANFSYGSSTFCAAAGVVTPVVAPGASGVFSASPAGLTINTTTGAIDMGSSSWGTYTITFVTSGACSATATQTITITNAPVTGLSYPGIYCQSAVPNIVLPVMQPGASAGVFTATPAGLALNPATGEIDLAASAPGTYTVTNSLTATTGCPVASSSAQVTIIGVSPPTASATSPVCTGGTIQLSASAAGASAYNWSGPATFVSSQQNPVVTNASQLLAGTYTVWAMVSGCQSMPATVQVSVLPAYTVQVISNSPVAEGGTLMLLANGNFGNNTVSWSGPNGFSATGTSPYIQNVDQSHSGTYTATVLPVGCSPASASTLVLVSVMNRIAGTVYNDSNNNGVQDAGEQPIAYQLMRILPNHYTTSNSQGAYEFAVPAGSFTVVPDGLETYQQVQPASYTVTFAGVGQSSTGHTVGRYTMPVTDLEVSILPLTAARPGFGVTYRLACQNVGNTASTATLRFKPDSRLIFNSAAPVAGNISNDTLIWNTGLLQPNVPVNYTVYMTLPASVPIGAYLNSTTQLLPGLTDANMANNYATLEQLVTGSYDPNDKLAQPLGGITPQQVQAQEPLVYTIRFQNTGTDTAFTVMVADTLSQHLDMSTFRMLSASHAYDLSVRGQGIMEWRFPNILLPDSNRNEPASHGYIQYSVKPKVTTTLGTTIENTAHIYFDFNEAVVTNTTQTSIILVSAPATVEEAQLQVYPNPTSGTVQLQLPEGSAAVQVRLTNLLGQEVLRQEQEHSSGSWQQQIDLGRQPAGVYLLQVQQGGKSYSRKVVLQR